MNCYYSIFYVPGLFLACAYDDVSYKKVATQSHTILDTTSTGTDASNAVDRNTATCIKTRPIGINSPDKAVWWTVDLGGVYNIYSINIQFKNYNGYEDRQRGRFAGFSLYMSNSGDIQGSTLCYKDGPQLPPLNFTIPCTESGRYVIFYNERLDGATYPIGYTLDNVYTELCEVIVQGCNNASFYGSNCDTPCPTNCKDKTCHIQSGACSTCKPGWTDIHCNKKCADGWYGLTCSHQCVGHCRDGAYCNHVTGQCDTGCDAGSIGALCDIECEEGTYGSECVNNCSGHCLDNSPCNKKTGACDRGCEPGYTNGDCSKECSPGHFGLDCSEHCSGHCKNNEPCDHVNGVCPSGCQDGYIEKRCDDTCNEGYFGTNCSQKCSPHCKPDTCRYTDGSCTTCAAGWTGHNCSTECMMYYGENCKYRCNLNCINQTCDRINGSCLYGCKEEEICVRDVANFMVSYSASNNLPLIVGGTVGVGACVFIIIGVVKAIFVIRRKFSNTKDHTINPQFCLRSTSVAEQRVNTEGVSNYQELNFALDENPYQSISQ